jgi:nitroreductase
MKGEGMRESFRPSPFDEGMAGDGAEGAGREAAAASLAHSLAQLFQERFSCRAFRPDPVPRETLRAIIATAARAPSWCNAQPWQVSLLSGPALERFREGLHAHAQRAEPSPDFPWPEAYPGVYGERRRACGYALYESVGIARGDREAARRQALENYRLFGAPHCAVITSPAALGVYGAIDCGGFITAFLLAARAHGVDTIPQAAIAAFPDFVRAACGLPAERKVVCAISLGYADPSHPANGFRTTRAALEEIVTFLDA